MTGSDGVAEFRTIYPGWYSGRAVHIHVKVHQRGRDGSFTGQLFFDERVTAAIYETDPYRLRPGPDTSNSQDGIFLQGRSSTLVAITNGDGGYNGEITLGLQRG
jgi:protocatechuate 3,4-dioxygenase beta subunit